MKKILSLGIIVVAMAACGQKGGDKKAELASLKQQQADINAKIATLEKELGTGDNRASKVFFIQVTPVQPTGFNHYIELQGSVVADDEYYLSAKVPGAIRTLNIKVGDRVKAGQVVATIDDDLMQNQMDELKKRWELANEVYVKQESLWKQNIGSEIQYLSAKNNKESLEKAMATLSKGRENYQIVAPIAGVVDEVTFKLGQIVSPGLPLAKIVNFTKLKVRAEVPETYAGKVRQGNAVNILFPDLQKEVGSRIGYVGNSVNPQNRTFKVEVPLRPNEAQLLPNMMGVIRVVDYSNASAMVVPINVLKKDLESDFVLIEVDGKATKAVVKVGQVYGDKAEILGGLKPGDRLITVGYEDLNEGDKVKVN